MSILTLGVRDLARSIRFYKDGLGLPVQQPGFENIAFFELRGTWLALYPRHLLAEDAQVADDAAGNPPFTIAHNVQSKALVDQVLAQAVQAGATLLKPAQDVFWGGYSGYFKDPDGFLWEIAWSPNWKFE